MFTRKHRFCPSLSPQSGFSSRVARYTAICNFLSKFRSSCLWAVLGPHEYCRKVWRHPLTAVDLFTLETPFRQNRPLLLQPVKAVMQPIGALPVVEVRRNLSGHVRSNHVGDCLANSAQLPEPADRLKCNSACLHLPSFSLSHRHQPTTTVLMRFSPSTASSNSHDNISVCQTHASSAWET